MNIMVHHLHGGDFKPVKGSVSIERFKKIVNKNPKCVLTFDDRLPSQELALDFLKEKGIRAYFFVVNKNEMEQDRMVREKYGDKFYEWFFSFFQPLPSVPSDFLSEYDFYTKEDKIYRYIRDKLSPNMHDIVMSKEREEIELLDLDLIKDHEIGLHSYSHPRDMSALTFEDQFMEFYRNKELNPFAFSMSHPMGRYNENTLLILKELGIRIGFRSDDKEFSQLEKARVDICLL